MKRDAAVNDATPTKQALGASATAAEPAPAERLVSRRPSRWRPRKSGLKNDCVIRPSSSTPYASPSPRMAGQPRPVRRAISLINTAPLPYRSASSRKRVRKLGASEDVERGAPGQHFTHQRRQEEEDGTGQEATPPRQ